MGQTLLKNQEIQQWKIEAKFLPSWTLYSNREDNEERVQRLVAVSRSCSSTKKHGWGRLSSTNSKTSQKGVQCLPEPWDACSAGSSSYVWKAGQIHTKKGNPTGCITHWLHQALSPRPYTGNAWINPHSGGWANYSWGLDPTLPPLGALKSFIVRYSTTLGNKWKISFPRVTFPLPRYIPGTLLNCGIQ